MAKKALDMGTVGGLALGFGSLFASMILEFHELNPDLGSQFLKMSAILIIFGGSFGCVMTSFPIAEMLKLSTYMRIALFGHHEDPQKFIDTAVKMAELARKEGILALESRLEGLDEEFPFFAEGLRFAIDGRSAETTKDILTDKVLAMEDRHKVGASVFTSLGGYAPTMGIVGTVIGLIGALSKAGEGGGDPSAIVEAIATAFIATFYGIGLANLFFLPVASKLQARSAEEVHIRLVQIQAVLGIQGGENPRWIGTSLKVYFQQAPVAAEPEGKK